MFMGRAMLGSLRCIDLKGGRAKAAPLRNRVFRIFCPFFGIMYDVIPETMQLPFIADHPFVIITLPERLAGARQKSVNLHC